MVRKTLWKPQWLVLMLVVLCPSAWCSVPAADGPPIIVSVHNDAGIPPTTLMQSEAEASRIFEHSGLEIRWLNCPLPPDETQDQALCATADFPAHFQLRIVKHSLNLSELIMGISYLSADGIGCYADLFFDRANNLHEVSHVSLASILGHGMAHELGHLLLGTNSHSPTGLMRARWEPADLVSASQGVLRFSSLESQQMRKKLAVWQAQDRHVSQIAAALLGD